MNARQRDKYCNYANCSHRVLTRMFFFMTHISNKLKIIVSWEDMA